MQVIGIMNNIVKIIHTCEDSVKVKDVERITHVLVKTLLKFKAILI